MHEPTPRPPPQRCAAAPPPHGQRPAHRPLRPLPASHHCAASEPGRFPPAIAALDARARRSPGASFWHQRAHNRALRAREFARTREPLSPGPRRLPAVRAPPLRARSARLRPFPTLGACGFSTRDPAARISPLQPLECLGPPTPQPNTTRLETAARAGASRAPRAGACQFGPSRPRCGGAAFCLASFKPPRPEGLLAAIWCNRLRLSNQAALEPALQRAGLVSTVRAGYKAALVAGAAKRWEQCTGPGLSDTM